MTSSIILAPQLEAILKQEAFNHCLELPDTIRTTREYFFLFIRHGGPQLFFVTGNQLDGFMVFLTGGGIILGRLNVTIPKFFQDSHTASSL
jgi:hypothetical protein